MRRTMGKTRNSAAVLVVVTTLFAIITVSEGENSTVGPSSLHTTASLTMTTEEITTKTAATTNLQTQKSNDQFVTMIEQLMQNPNIISNFVQSLIPALTDVLKSAISGANGTATPTSPTEALLRKLIAGLSDTGNWSSPDLASGIGRSGMQVVDTVEKYFNKPIVKQTLLLLVTRVVNILREEVAKHNNGTFPPISDLPAALGHIGVSTVLQRLLQAGVPQKLLQALPHGQVQDACFRDTVDTLEGLVSFKKWALDMFDATGKIESGIQKGHFYFIGSYDQCYDAKPTVETEYAGGFISSRTFGTHFCRADIGIPDSLIKSLNVDTRGVKLKLTWGLCMPDSCKSKDVEGLFDVGKDYNISLPIEKVYCYEDEDLSSDTSAIIAICILSVFGLIIASGTLIDSCRAYFAAEDVQSEEKSVEPPLPPADKYTKPPEANGIPMTNYITAKDTAVNMDTVIATEAMNGDLHTDKSDLEIQLPPGYVAHRETGIEIIKSDHARDTVSRTANKGENITQRTTTKNKDGIIIRLLLCFSLYTNIPKILNAKSSRGSVACIHGIRFFSLTWVVLGHTYNYGVISMEETLNAANLLDFVGILQRFTYQTVVAGGFAVDTFFVLSAFLLTWLHLKDKSKKKNKCTIGDSIYFYFHRFWRLSPIYMFILMAFACLYKYLGSGPMWPSSITTAENCKDYWWTNLLYVNNLVHLDNQCMGWTWYLANDMQFYVVSPIFLFAMLISPAVGGVFTCILLAIGMGCAFWKEYVYNGNFFTMKEDGGDYWRQVYIVPWCRVGCWAVGMLLGLLVYRRGSKPLRNKVVIRLGWLLATAVALFLVYIPYTEQKKDGQTWTRVERAFYEGFGRPAWGACVAWVIFACFFGKGGIVNTILSWNGFIPLSRLTYAAYLVHPVCMMVNVWSRRTLLYVNDYSIIYLFLGHLCMTYMVAFVCSLAFEAPFMSLEKVLFHRGRRA